MAVDEKIIKALSKCNKYFKDYKTDVISKNQFYKIKHQIIKRWVKDNLYSEINIEQRGEDYFWDILFIINNEKILFHQPMTDKAWQGIDMPRPKQNIIYPYNGTEIDNPLEERYCGDNNILINKMLEDIISYNGIEKVDIFVLLTKKGNIEIKRKEKYEIEVFDNSKSENIHFSILDIFDNKDNINNIIDNSKTRYLGVANGMGGVHNTIYNIFNRNIYNICFITKNEKKVIRISYKGAIKTINK